MSEASSPQRWELVREVFGGALERDTGDRAKYLRRVCAGDGDLRVKVESLLEAHRAGRDFLAEPAVGKPAKALDDDEALHGRRLGAYRIERCIGRGGMGAVFSAVRADSTFEKRVAIKLLKRDVDSAEVERRFHAERQILAGLEHPNIARLLDGGTTENGRPYLVMEFVEGLPVDAYCDRHRLRISDRLELFRKICSAVQLAHRNLVVHRDLKPPNILVAADGEPKLLDFGIAKILESDSPTSPVAPETVLRPMTPDFASPEQVSGSPVTTASDVYSLGVMLYLLLTGRHPFSSEGQSQIEALWAMRNQEPEPPSSVIQRPTRGSVSERSAGDEPPGPIGRGYDPRRLRRRLAGDLDRIVLMALRKEPERRYASAEQLAEDLKRHLEGHPVLAATDSFRYRSGKFLRRHRLGVATAAEFMLAIIGFGCMMALQRSEIARERDLLAEQRQVTEIERQRAEQVTSFLVDLFEASDPFSRSADAWSATARELLDRGAERLSALDGKPEIRADLGHTVGVIYRRLGLLDEAAPLIESALVTRRRLRSSDHKKVASSLTEKGLLLREQGDYQAAQELHEEALAMRRRLFGDRHPAIADSLSHLASLAGALGDFQGAESRQRQALTIYRQHLGSECPAVATGLHRLAVILQSQGDHDGAEQAYREALAIQHRLFGDEHVEVAATRANLAQLFLRRGDVDHAERYYRQALRIFRHRFGDDHAQVAFCVHSLAVVLSSKGEIGAAEAHYREALGLLRRLRGPEHPDLGATLDGLAGVMLAAGDFRDAERTYREAMVIRRKAFGEGNPYLTISLTGLSRVATEEGDYDKAERLLDQALAIGRRAFPDGHWRLDVAESALGDCMTRAGRYSEAEPLLLDSYRGLKVRRGERALVSRKTLDRLVRLYEAWGRPGEAAKFRSQHRAHG